MRSTAPLLILKISPGGIKSMDSTTLIRVAAGILFVIVLVILIQRRRTRVK
jgi:hypothetical protein